MRKPRQNFDFSIEMFYKELFKSDNQNIQIIKKNFHSKARVFLKDFIQRYGVFLIKMKLIMLQVILIILIFF